LNDVPTHFVTFCPRCSTGLRVRSAYKGQQVQCKQCNDTFPAEEADGPHTTNSNGGGAVLLAQARPKEARIVVPCPECAATLRVRHSYVGHRVACKRCAHAFIASWPTESPLHPAHACPPATTATAWIERRPPWARVQPPDGARTRPDCTVETCRPGLRIEEPFGRSGPSCRQRLRNGLAWPVRFRCRSQSN
jgi:DNA-directed RNA polymerase subunit M/transcription elongation factor TFIIS